MPKQRRFDLVRPRSRSKTGGGPSKPADLGQAAFQQGQAALARGQKAEAIRWLDRAHRLAPNDPLLMASLAAALLTDDPARAASLFARVAAATDARDALLGLANAHLLLNDPAKACDALARALRHHSVHPGANGLAAQIVQAVGAPGWCGVSGGRMVHHGAADVIVKGGTVTAGGRHLIGSPIDVASMGRTEGFVEAGNDGLHGWVWLPADPETDPVLRVGSGGNWRTIVAAGPAEDIVGLSPLARPRGFFIPWEPSAAPERIAGGRNARKRESARLKKESERFAVSTQTGTAPEAPIHVRGPDGSGLTGSPVRQHKQAPEPCPAPPTVVVRRPMVIIMSLETRCAASIKASSVPVVTLDGDGIEPILAKYTNYDLVLLGANVTVPRGWLGRLRRAAYAAPDIATVTPLSNRGPAAYPGPDGNDLSWFAPDAPSPDRQAIVDWLDDLARRSGRHAPVYIPASGRPCLYIRADCVAGLRPTWFAEIDTMVEDLCPRASKAGWRHVVHTRLFVGTTSEAAGTSAAQAYARARGVAKLNELHPNRETNRTNDPLALARRRLDLARWKGKFSGTAIFVTHDDGGGVERRVEAALSARTTEGLSGIVLRPFGPGSESMGPDSNNRGVVVNEGTGRRFPNLRYCLPREKSALSRLLRATDPAITEIHHLLNHDPSILHVIRTLRVPYEVHTHDFAWYCPRIALVGRSGRYCGEPEPRECEVCVAETGSYLHEDIRITDLLARSRGILTGARRVIAPSNDTATRMIRHFPGLAIDVVPHETVSRTTPHKPPHGPVRICVAGAIGLHKGFHVLLDCAEDARDRGLDLSFVVAGTTIDDARLLETGRAFVTGPYQPDEAVALIRAQRASLAFLPSIWPETWCLVLSELWRAGLDVAAFDIGAQAERIRRDGRGLLLPLDLSASAINDALIVAAGRRSLLPILDPSAYKPSP